jgi:hypothetical protein
MADDLGQTTKDQLVALSRGAVGGIPYIGGVVGELLAMIPGQRVDRIAAYVRKLSERLEVIEAKRQRELLSRPDKVDFVEEGAWQAARAISDERTTYIAEAVFKGLTSEEADVIRRKRLLKLLGELDDDELTLLNAYGQSYGGSAEGAWEKTNRPDPAHMGSSVEQIDQEKLFEAGRGNLLRLGLLNKRFPSVRRGEQPEFDIHKGDFKHRLEVSYLGRMLLREIGLPSPIDAEEA